MHRSPGSPLRQRLPATPWRAPRSRLRVTTCRGKEGEVECVTTNEHEGEGKRPVSRNPLTYLLTPSQRRDGRQPPLAPVSTTAAVAAQQQLLELGLEDGGIERDARDGVQLRLGLRVVETNRRPLAKSGTAVGGGGSDDSTHTEKRPFPIHVSPTQATRRDGRTCAKTRDERLRSPLLAGNARRPCLGLLAVLLCDGSR